MCYLYIYESVEHVSIGESNWTLHARRKKCCFCHLRGVVHLCVHTKPATLFVLCFVCCPRCANMHFFAKSFRYELPIFSNEDTIWRLIGYQKHCSIGWSTDGNKINMGFSISIFKLACAFVCLLYSYSVHNTHSMSYFFPRLHQTDYFFK